MRLQRIVTFGAFMVVGMANASTTEVSAILEASAKVEETIITEAQASQKIVANSSDHAFELQVEIEAFQSELASLDVYQNHLTQLIKNQNIEKESLDAQLIETAETRQSIVPLMYQMINGLTQYIERDMPIRRDTRLERIEKLKVLMVQANISDAEKFRRILEAYQIELDYVNKLGTYTSEVEIAGTVRQVEQLNLGHLSFIARSLDKQQYWSWSDKEKEWVALDKKDNADLHHAFLVAKKQTSPSLLVLPLAVSEVSQ